VLIKQSTHRRVHLRFPLRDQQTSNPWAGDGSDGEEKSGGDKKKKGGEVKGAFS
jgi:hypothetical protein